MVTQKLSGLFVIVLLLFSTFIAVFLGSVSAINDNQNLTGIVWQSDGSIPTGQTEFAIWVNHSGIWNRFPDTGWAMTEIGFDNLWWYSFVLPDRYSGTGPGSRWTDGELYRVQVDGTPWGDYFGNATSNGTLPGPNSPSGDPQPFPYNPSNPSNTYNIINYTALGGYTNEQQWDVRTVAPVDLVPTNITADGKRPADDITGIPVPPNNDIPIFFNVTNYGNVSSGPFWVTLWNCTATGNNSGPAFIIELPLPSGPGGGDSGMQLAIWPSPMSPGDYYVNLTVDSHWEIPEIDEINNRESLHFVVGPELIIINVLVNGAPPSDPVYVGPGAVVVIMANTQNVGPSSTGTTVSMTLYNTTGFGGPIIPGS